MPFPRPVVTIWFVVCLLATSLLSADEKPQDTLKDSKTPPNFNDDIKAILRQHCLKCHGDDEQEAGINLQRYATLLKGGSGGKIVVAGRSSQSLLFNAITNQDADARMPPNSPRLADSKIAMIQRWIDTGLRESSASASLTKVKDLTFKPAMTASTKPAGEPAMPTSLPVLALPKRKRSLPILAMDCSPWAPVVAVSGYEHIKLFHSQTKQPLGELAFPEGEPHVIRFSRDGSVLMAAGGRPVHSGRVVLFDVKSGKRLAEIGDELDAILAADLSPDQRLVALGGSNRIVKVYSAIDGTLKYKIEKHTDWITSLTFSPDGKNLATADRAGGIHLWDAKSGGILLNLSDHKASVRALDWRGDSKLLASVSEDGSIIWWDVTDGFPAISIPNAHPPVRPAGVFGRIPNGILAARFDKGGNLVTAGRDRVIRLWSAKGAVKQSIKIETGIPISGSISHDGKTILSGDSTGNLGFWDAK